LGVTKTHSRLHVSDDNPYSESQFRNMKYRPEFADRLTRAERVRVHLAQALPEYGRLCVE
jgi:putative transposase